MPWHTGMYDFTNPEVDRQGNLWSIYTRYVHVCSVNWQLMFADSSKKVLGSSRETFVAVVTDKEGRVTKTSNKQEEQVEDPRVSTSHDVECFSVWPVTRLDKTLQPRSSNMDSGTFALSV